MAREDYVKELIKRRADELGLEFSEEMSLILSGLYDSLSFFELIFEIESEFKIEIDFLNYDVDYFTSYRGLLEIIRDAKSIKKDEILNKTSKDELYEICYLGEKFELKDELKPLFRQSYELYEKTNNSLRLKENAADLWLDFIAKTLGKSTQIIILTYENKIVGFLEISIKIAPSYYKEQIIGQIDNIYIKENHKGFSKKMLKLGNEWFRQKNTDLILLQVVNGNDKALAFWQNLGFSLQMYQLKSV